MRLELKPQVPRAPLTHQAPTGLDAVLTVLPQQDFIIGEIRCVQRRALITEVLSSSQAWRLPHCWLVTVGGGLWGALWGSLVGLLFLNPLAGFAFGTMVGAGTGALAGSLSDYGINDDFIRELAKTLQPGHSALFVLVRKVQPEKVLAELSRFRGKVLRSSLSPEQEARLQSALSGGAPEGKGARASDERAATQTLSAH